jgi:FKBP-type peptidyl-prolyl cis-trans isomerase 2
LVDLNHPLAGPLIVTLQIVTVENPDEEVNIDTVPGHDNHPKLIAAPEPHDVSPGRNLAIIAL